MAARAESPESDWSADLDEQRTEREKQREKEGWEPYGDGWEKFRYFTVYEVEGVDVVGGYLKLRVEVKFKDGWRRWPECNRRLYSNTTLQQTLNRLREMEEITGKPLKIMIRGSGIDRSSLSEKSIDITLKFKNLHTLGFHHLTLLPLSDHTLGRCKPEKVSISHVRMHHTHLDAVLGGHSRTVTLFNVDVKLRSQALVDLTLLNVRNFTAVSVGPGARKAVENFLQRTAYGWFKLEHCILGADLSSKMNIHALLSGKNLRVLDVHNKKHFHMQDYWRFLQLAADPRPETQPAFTQLCIRVTEKFHRSVTADHIISRCDDAFKSSIGKEMIKITKCPLVSTIKPVMVPRYFRKKHPFHHVTMPSDRAIAEYDTITLVDTMTELDILLPEPPFDLRSFLARDDNAYSGTPPDLYPSSSSEDDLSEDYYMLDGQEEGLRDIFGIPDSDDDSFMEDVALNLGGVLDDDPLPRMGGDLGLNLDQPVDFMNLDMQDNADDQPLPRKVSIRGTPDVDSKPKAQRNTAPKKRKHIVDKETEV
ncbi:hypothetical protein HK097_003726 [Rhizophlyctis rosea]|uniref:Uncharacterized protein n=1 Tax=Rhizophlyctis rosea TaxID=64517 RepID=A0AAD5SJH9_9FUNG|nr:hypothetical protein HK097_003726 [Rhizophlyctis rosea]